MPLELHFPRLLEGGGHAVAPGVILPPGMKLRNPAFLKPRHFRSTLTETLLVWDVSGGQDRIALGRKVEGLWVRCQTFRKWAKVVYAANVRRARRLRASHIRFAVAVPSGAMMTLKLSPLDQVGRVKVLISQRKPALMTKKLAKYVVMLDGVALDDWLTCHDAGVREASSLVVTARAVGTDDDVPPQPHLVSTGAGALSPKTVRMAMMAYGSLATPKKPEEEHKIHPGWRPRARLGRQFPSDSPKKGPVLAPTCPAAPDSPEARAR
ncbi:unnamed protein product [Pelagomonas calceolata]|uniref:Ubiquitin-like domain-containing protein n=1 Tax=Pelagomonas calceolata TaxID=35677 RepID=A0A7S4A8U5_9STRA|nr:unnamed protein product [Pelagomonas calceolata]